MANKNFTQFALSGTAESGDFLVGYKKDGSQELRFTTASILTAGNYDFIINGVNVGRGPGTSNIVLGASALNTITTGRNNIAIGNFALSACTSSSNNIAIGTNALASLTAVGSDNIAIGNFALSGLKGDAYNIAIGNRSLKSAVGANANISLHRVVNNVAVGNEAMFSALTALSNVVLGNYTLSEMLSGEGNTAVGASAGAYNIFSGLNNTLVGSYTTLLNRATNCSVLGYGATATGNNEVQLGNAATTVYYYQLQVRSDIRDKADVRDTALGLDFIMALRPVDFKWDLRDSYRTPPPAALPPVATKEEKENHKILIEQWKQANDMNNIVHDGTHKRTRYHHGLIAQEVKQVLDDKGIDFGGYQDHSIKGGKDVLSIGYDELVAPLIKAIQELKQEFDAYKASHP